MGRMVTNLLRRTTFRRHFHQNSKRQRPKCIKAIFVAIFLSLLTHKVNASIYTNCGGVLEDPRGVVQSPGFPGPFPLPVSCRWIIHVPPEKKVVLYFTQYFLRKAFYVTEYDQYNSEVYYTGRKSLGEFNFEDHIHTVVAYKPYLVLDFRLHKMSNIHLRVEEHLEDVYGFNITYEVVDRAERVRQDTCSVVSCSFLGHCVVAEDFSRYWCQCFPGFFGKNCQYGPYCDPDKGINMCRNKGRCRYFYGSMVNVCECPPGYVGPMCEHREDILPAVINRNASSSSDDSLTPECADLGCRDRCERSNDGHLHCVCREGFRLAQDNVTCVEEKLYRVSVIVPVVLRPADWDVRLAATQATSILHLAGLKSAERFQYHGINSTDEHDLLLMHFYVDGSDVSLVHVGLDSLFHAEVHNLTLLADNYTLQVDPEMKILSLENYDAESALEGKSLTLVCTARGSGRLHFRWYKDKFLFNASLTSRAAWEVRIQDEFDDKQMSIFNVDGVTMFDKGTFSCEIEDFGEVRNKTLTVDVMPLPHVEIKPLVANVLRGESLSFRCISYDENTRTFSYQWLRDGRPITGEKDYKVNGEQVEDLLPSGSRLFIPRLVARANYTCRVLNKAGAAQMSAQVYLIEPEDAPPTCEGTSQAGVKWNRTYGGYFDLQQCPIETAEFKVVGLEEGHARRDCVCDVSRCRWGPPNYARCHSVHLIFLYEQLKRCQLGYQDDDLGLVWDSLYEILHMARNRTLAGDVDMFAINLYTLVDITRRFPAVAPGPGGSFSLKTVASYMDMLLGEVRNTNEFEKQDLSVGSRFLHVCEILAQLTRENSTVVPLLNLTLPRIAFAVKSMKLIYHNATMEGSDVDRKQKSAEEEVNQGHQSARRLMSVSNRLDKEGIALQSEGASLRVLQVTFSPVIFPILRVRTRRPELKEFLTPLVSLLPLGDTEGGDYFLDGDPHDPRSPRVLLDFVHSQQFPSVENITRCVAWDRRDSQALVGEWDTEVCDVTHRGINRTRCLCPVLGHYAVVVSASNTSVGPVLQVYQDTVLLVGCMLCMCGLLATLLVLFLYWRHMSGYSSVIHVNFIISLAGINLICLLCLSRTHKQTLCMVGKLCLHFLQLAAFAFLLMEATHTYVCIQSAGLAGLTRVKYTYAKYCLVGWGVPTLATLAVVLLSEIFDYDEQCSTWCWWSPAQWQQFSFMVPLLVMVVVQVFIIVACLISTRKWTDEHRFRDRKKYRYIAVRSLVLVGFVVLLSVSGHLTNVRPSLGRQWFFVLVDILLTMVVVVTLLFFKPHVRRLVYSVLLPAHKRVLASDSFRAFVLPDRVEDTEEAEVKRIQQFCTEQDRSKFTTQHKETLRTLLGSSTSGSEVTGTVSPSSSSGSGGTSAVHCLPGPSGKTSGFSSSHGGWNNCGKNPGSSACSHGSWNECGGRVCPGEEPRRTPVRKSRGRRGGDPREKHHRGGSCEVCGYCGEIHERGTYGNHVSERCGGEIYTTRDSRGSRRGGGCGGGLCRGELCASERYEPDTKRERQPREKHLRKGADKTPRGLTKYMTKCGEDTESRDVSSERFPAHRLLALCEAKLGLVVGGGGTGGIRDLRFRDSGYEGTESDSHSFPHSSSVDHDSPASSRSDLTGGGGDEEEGGGGGEEGGGDFYSTTSSSSSFHSSPELPGPVIPRIALLTATPLCSPNVSRRTIDSDTEEGWNRALVTAADVNRDVTADLVTAEVNCHVTRDLVTAADVNCDVTEDGDVPCFLEDVSQTRLEESAESERLLNSQTPTAQIEETAEYESLLNSLTPAVQLEECAERESGLLFQTPAMQLEQPAEYDSLLNPQTQVQLDETAEYESLLTDPDTANCNC